MDYIEFYKKMHKNNLFIFILLLLSSTYSFGQRTSTSLYSRYNYGEMYVPSAGYSQLGNVANGLRAENQIQYINPAHYTAISKETFLFQVGAGYTSTIHNENTNKSSSFGAGLEHLAMAFPIIPQKIGMGFGLFPYSSLGYSTQTTDEVAQYKFSGSGGMNQVIWGVAVNPIKPLSIGFNVHYVFGASEYTSVAKILNQTLSYNTEKKYTYRANSFMWDAGIQYTMPLKEESTIIFGTTFTPRQKLSYDLEYFMGTYNSKEIKENIAKKKKDKVVIHEEITYIDTLAHTNTNDFSYTPQTISVGIGYTNNDAFKIALDYGWNKWESVSPWNNNKIYNNFTQYLRFGTEYTPDYRSRTYLKKLPYKFGMHYSELPIKTNSNMQVVEFGMSFGSEFTLRQTANSLAATVSINKRGSIEKNADLQELYIKVGLLINLKDRWFVKRKID